jgi:hypothetical protein
VSRRWIAPLLAVLLASCAQLWLALDDPEMKRWRARASELRGLEFRRPVQLVWIEPGEVRALLRDELSDLLRDDYPIAYRDALAALGLLPANLDLAQTYLDVNVAQLGGLYSPRRRTMYVLRGTERVSEGLVLHELGHALQHQHFSTTLGLMQGLRRNDDVVLALSAVLEGDATLLMLAGARAADGEIHPEAVRSLHAALRLDLDQPMGVLAGVPTLVRTALMFPYVEGLVLVQRHRSMEGWDGVDALLRDPPLTTRRVLDPLSAAPAGFIGLDLDWLGARSGCRVGHDNVAGVVGIEVLLRDHGSVPEHEMLAEWAGDRFVQLGCDTGAELLWVSRWRSATAATSFAAAYARIAAPIAAEPGRPREASATRVGTSVVVATPGVAHLAGEALARSQVREYADLAEWLADACFPESPCPQR